MITQIAQLLGQVLEFIAASTGNLGLAIILLTIGIKIVLHPLTRNQLKSMKAMQALAPQIEVLRRKYRSDQRQLNIEVMNLYRTNRINPLMGCLPLLLQMPVLYALFVLLRSVNLFDAMSFWIVLEHGYPVELADQLCDAGRICEVFAGLKLGVMPAIPFMLDHPQYVIVPILSGVTTYWQQRVTMTTMDPAQARMFIFMPFMIAYFATQFIVALSVYWITSTLLSVAEYYIVVGKRRKVAIAAPKGAKTQARTAATTETQAQK